MSQMSTNGTDSGGDERIMYNQRYKPTNNSSKTSSIESLPKTMGESETTSRSKQSKNIVKHSNIEKNNTKNKLRIPVKIGLELATNRINKPHNNHKEFKKTSSVLKKQNLIMKMKQESGSLERNQKSLNVQIGNKDSTMKVENNKNVNESNHKNDQKIDHPENSNVNGLDRKEILEENFNDNEYKKNGKTENNGVILVANENEEDFNLHLESEENLNSMEEKMNKSNDLLEINIEDNIQNELKTLVEEEHFQNNSEKCSEDVVESTTSEVSEAIEPISLDIKNKDNLNQNENSDAVSYDSSIMLKDVKIKLNDCLKDTKIGEENYADQGLLEYAHKETTFGKTLRTISGRNSIGRMRHITLRDKQPSPNSSLFVNISSISLSEDSITDYKTIHHNNTISELASSNNGGTPIDRKRKLITEYSTELKKPKTEKSSLWNASFELFKYPFGLQRPVQLSTSYKFQTEKHSLCASKESKTDESGIIKKWCVIM